MQIVFVLMALFLGSIATLLLLNPKPCFEFAHKHFLSAKFQYLVSIVGLLLGVAIYYSSATTKFPTAFEVVAISSAVSSAFCLILPKEYFKALVSWELEIFAPYGRLLGAVYAVMGLVLVYVLF